MSTLKQQLRDSLRMCAAALQAACLPGHPLSEKDTVTAGDGSYMTIRQILDTADAALEMPRAFPPAAQAVPDGWARVPSSFHIPADAFEALASTVDGPDERWMDGTAWIGEITNDDGSKTHGLHIMNAGYPEEGSITLAEFAAAPTGEVES